MELAALVLIKDKGARTGRPIDAYWRYAGAYNGSGPAATAYADRVIADAHAYQGQGTASVAVLGCVGALGGYINPFRGETWGLARNDMGVDYDPLNVEPVRAIGAGTIVGIGSWEMYGQGDSYYRSHHRRMSALRARRLALTAVAAGLVIAGEGLATLSPAVPQTHHTSRPPTVARHPGPKPYGGEPRPSQDSSPPRAPWIAAVRLVRDYAGWQAGRLARLPSHDASERVMRLVEHAGRHRLGATRDLTRSVRMAASENRYLATSAVGNFLIGRRGSRWLVVSTPGD